MGFNPGERLFYIRVVFFLAGIILAGKAAHLQLFSTEYRNRSEAAVIDNQIIYPSRGSVFDRNGKLLVTNNPMYDLMVTINQTSPNMDTAKLCELLGIQKSEFAAAMTKDWKSGKYSKRLPFVFWSKISPEMYARLQESLYLFPGFEPVLRSVRGYPYSSAPHVLGYIREVNKAEVNDSVYNLGDYIGASGLEKKYEKELRGKKGIRKVLKDNLGREVGEFMEGKENLAPVSGNSLHSTLDLDLQAYGEMLMQNKIGSIVAIKPDSGEILAMISSPYYDPNKLVIHQGRAKAYAELEKDSLLPLYNRALQAQYPPGSLFKSVVALIALQEGVITNDHTVRCQGGYFLGGQKLTGCHGHATCTTVTSAIQHSCNAYFVSVFRDIIDHNNDITEAGKGLAKFNEYLYRFGLGSPLGVDVPNEKGGNVPTPEDYDKKFVNEKYWKSIWIRSLGIGQGELLFTNLQMANLAAIIANRGYYYTPHLMRYLEDDLGHKTRSTAFLTPKNVGIDAKHFATVVDGMEWVVKAGTARSAYIEDIPICGKTGTAENNQGNQEDHSIFFAFAPKDNPQIAIAVYVENASWGGTYAAPIASLMIEKYLKRSIRPERLYLEKRMMDANLIPQTKKPRS